VKKCLLLVSLAMMAALSLHAQQGNVLRLISSSYSRVNPSKNLTIHYRPVYEHNGSTLSADSGYLYKDNEARQFFEAFGKVIITQPNGTVIYADKLHYTVDTRLATLTNNVRMVDGNAVLTTNYLTYNMNTHVGTYTGGGRIVNTTDTITSRNAYYFDNTKDAYFRHNVVVRTPDVNIFTDTMRYNSATKMTYFYGPTNIKGHGGENLYTERGEYNTETKQAWFDHNNLYTEGSRFLRGDSLYYDGQVGVGRAVNNVVFIDTADQFFAYGGMGLYRSDNESITMTERPLVVTVTRNDTTASDTSAVGSIATPIDSIATPIDSVGAPSLTLPDTDTLARSADSLGMPPASRPAVDTIYMTADTLFSQLIRLKDYVPKVFDLDREGGEIMDYEDQDYGEDPLDPDDAGLTDTAAAAIGLDALQQPPAADSLAVQPDTASPVPDGTPSPPDTLRAPSDSLAIAYKDSVAADLAAKTDAAVLNTHIQRVEAVPLATQLGHDALAKNLVADSLLRSQVVIPSGGEADSLMAEAAAALLRPAVKDTIPKDSLANDTARTRIVKAYYNVRLFKSDLQAVADSVYYGYPDSMMRFFGRPMIWAQGSQMTADTIYMQIRNEQLDNMLFVGNAFIVNTQLDSSKYNQVKGRQITGFFKNNELERMFVDGNAESLYYLVNDKRGIFTDMYHSRASRFKILLDSNAITHFIPIRRLDSKLYPIHLIPQEAEILDGFVWKPGDRPTSKEDLLARQRPPADAGIAIPADTARTDTTGGRPLTGEDPPPTELSPSENAPDIPDGTDRPDTRNDAALPPNRRNAAPQRAPL